jgi:hypothetical protein
MDTNKLIAIEAWSAAVRKGGDPEEWRGVLGLTWEELCEHADVTMAVKAMADRYRENILSFFPKPLRSYVVLTVAKAARTSTAVSTGNTASTSRGKAYQPKLDAYTWTYKGKTASIRRVDGGWEAVYDGHALGVYPSHTQAIEAVYRLNGVTAALNAVKLAKLREQDAAAGFAD